MPTLADYAKADCKRFRLPPVEVSRVAHLLERSMVEAWNRGMSAEEAVRTISGNGELIKELGGELKANLEYRQAHELKTLDSDRKQAFAAYDREKELAAAQVDAQTQARTQEITAEIDRTAGTIEQASTARSASQARLEEMRARVQEKLARIGGKEGYDLLNGIDAAFSTPGQAPLLPGAPAPAMPGVPVVSGAPAAVPAAGEPIATAPTSLEELVTGVPAQPKKRGFWRTIGHAIYKAVTYEVW